MPTKNDLLDRRASIWEEAKKLNDDVEARDGQFTAEERATWDRLNSEMDALDERVERQVEIEKREASIREKTGGRDFAQQNPYPMDKFVRSFLANPSRSVELNVPESVKIPIFQNVDEIRAYRQRLEERADMAKGASGTGGAVVAEPIFVNLLEYLAEGSGIIGAGVTIITTSKGEQMTWPRVSSYGGANAEVTEAGSGDATEPTFTTAMTLDAYKYMQTVRVSRELIDDAMIDIGQFVLRAIAFNIMHGTAGAPGFGVRIAVGDGSGKPNGLVSASTLGATGATSVSGVPNLDNLIDLQYAVAEPYAMSPATKWVMKRSTAGTIRKFREGSGSGAYLWEPRTQVGQPDLLLGDPVVQDPFVAATATSAKSIVYGDLAKYIVRLVGSIRLERDDSVAFEQDQVSFKAVLRGDADLSHTAAVKHFVGGAS